MKMTLPILAALVLGVVSHQALAQSQQEAQQACEGDVYNLCGDKIPDQDAIVACLRKKWHDVSKECRHVMATYGRHHRGHRRETSGSGPMGKASRY